MWSKNKKALLWILAAVLVLAVAGAFLTSGLLLPYIDAKNTMDPAGALAILTREDGALQVQWPEGENAECYELQILETDGTLLHCASTTECFGVLPELPADRELVVRITSGHGYSRWIRSGDESLEATLKLAPPELGSLEWFADVDEDAVTVSFDMNGADLCRVYMATGEETPVQIEEIKDGSLQLCFGDGEKYPVPEHGQPLRLTFQLEKQEGQVFLQGSDRSGFLLTREDLLDKELTVECTDNGENSYTLTWNETKGAEYEVLLSTNGGESWTTLAAIPCDGERTYTTEHLQPYTDYTLWVVAVGGQTMPNSEFAAVSQQLQLKTGARLLYSTIWPLMDQTVYGDPEATQELGTAAAGSAWCVTGMVDKYLKIRFNGQDGYIDSEYCMINLPEYIGDLCLYDITNSYYSRYLVHEYGISRVSGTVITGYENVKIGEDEYLAPLLFPTAQKLIKAGEAAKEAGYTLKIYDSYRPKKATERIYSLTAAILENKVPSSTFSGKTVKDLNLLKWDPDEVEEPATDESGETIPAETQPKVLTYSILMTNNGAYYLGQFLAPGTSRHNFGVALDLTMVDADGKELSMQTSMHDLSWYSAFKRNNTNANTLYKIMSGAGLQNISSEWWHYQDNAVYETHSYKPLREGVSFECWVLDDHGWRYRLNDGSFYTSSTQTIEDQSYTFDENGYVTQ